MVGMRYGVGEDLVAALTAFWFEGTLGGTACALGSPNLASYPGKILGTWLHALLVSFVPCLAHMCAGMDGARLSTSLVPQIRYLSLFDQAPRNGGPRTWEPVQDPRPRRCVTLGPLGPQYVLKVSWPCTDRHHVLVARSS